MLKAIIFDFDGVICESNDIKTQAFKHLFRDHPGQLDEIVKYHAENGGLSRYEKFKVIYNDYLKKELMDEESSRLGEEFSRVCYKAVIEAPYVKGAFEFLEKYYAQLSLFIASGTPEDEMVAIVRQKGLEKYFKAVYGSPRSKQELINLILHENNINADQAVFVGDSINDQEGAEKAGVHFIGRLQKNQLNPFRNLPSEKLIWDLENLESIIRDN